jgi:hypothetical protein
MQDGCDIAAGEVRRVQTPVQTSKVPAIAALGNDVFITSVDRVSRQVARGRAKPHESKGSARPRWRPKTPNDKGVDPA